MPELAERTRARGEPIDAFLLARMLVFVAVVPLITMLRLPRMTAVLERVRVAPCTGADAMRIRRHAEIALRPFLRFTPRPCLLRALTMYWFLRRAGIDVGIAFGVGRPTGQAVGHCWLTRDGAPLWERRDPAPIYAELYRIPR